MRKLGVAIFAAVIIFASAPKSHAILIGYTSTLSGAEEVGNRSSTGTGSATLTFDTDTSMLSVSAFTFSNLLSAATAAHIHGPASPGVNAPVLFPFDNVPAATSGSVPNQTFTLNATQVAQLTDLKFYINIHSATIPAGEIRGQVVPEPSSMALMGIGVVGGLYHLRRRSRRSSKV